MVFKVDVWYLTYIGKEQTFVPEFSSNIPLMINSSGNFLPNTIVKSH